MRKAKSAYGFTGTLERSDNGLWGCHIRVPPQIAASLTSGRSRRVVRTLNGGSPRQCALLPVGGGHYVISVNKAEQKRLGLAIGTDLRVELLKDATPYGLPVPEELRELLRQDREGDRLFHALTPGRQRTLLYLVDAVEDPERRATRALAVVRHHKATGGTIDYKQLTPLLRSRRG
jgi:hypothetical protein